MGRSTRRQPAPPGTARRAAVYLRVSSEEQVEGYSLDAQQRATRAYCDAHRYEVVEEYRDEGRSARTDGVAVRPAFARMLADAEAGRVDVVVVHKLDRFSRNRRVAFEALDRLGRARVGFVSIAEDMDYSSPSGQLMLTMLIGMGQFYSDNLSFETKKGKAERKRQGMYNGHLPFGAAKDERGVPVPHPEHHAGLVLAFELAARGKPDRAVAQALTEAGYRTTGNRGGKVFSKDTVCHLLQNRFYLGELPDEDGGWIPGRHAALIDPDLFERAKAARLRNTRPHRLPTVRRSPWALSGVATCVECGRSVLAHGRMDGKQRAICSGRTQGLGCTAKTFYAARVEDQIGEALGSFVLEPEQQAELVTAWTGQQRATASLAPTRAGIERKLDRLREAYLAGDLDRAEWQQRQAPLRRELDALPADLPANEQVARRLAGYLADIASAWKDATAEEKNGLARALFSDVLIENRTAVAVLPKPELRPFFVAMSEKSSEADPGYSRSASLPGCQSGTKFCAIGGSDGGPFRGCILPPGAILFASIPARRLAGASRRDAYQQPRSRRLSADQEAELRRMAPGRTLRDLAMSFDVSHETVRKTLLEALGEGMPTPA